jgi:hypothetical protein
MIATTPLGETGEDVASLGSNAALPEFSLVAGGPTYRCWCRFRLADKSLRFLSRRILLAILIGWLPLLLLAMLEGYAWNGVRVSFLGDASLHLRLLLAVPLLLAAEPVIHEWMRPLTSRFIERGIVASSSRPKFDAAVNAVAPLRDSSYPELVMLIAVLALGIPIHWHRAVALEDSTWYWTLQDGSRHITLAGWWAGLISLPLFQFLLLRWYFRLFIWAQFLWRVSRLELKLAPTQPDCAGGLGFIGSVTEGFWVLVIAHGVICVAVMVHGMLYGGMTLQQYELEICVLWAVTLFWVVVPLLPFAPTLHRAKRAGKNAYGVLSQQYAVDFDRKWMSGGVREENLLGTGDIQSLADLRNGYEVVRSMRLLPIGRETVVRMMIFSLIPVAPLALALVPLDRLLEQLMTALF